MSTQDNQLLQDAARAAGWSWWRSKHGYWNITTPSGSSTSCCHSWQKYDPDTGEKLPEPEPADALIECGWNPLLDDGDALRLAVKLRIRIEQHPSWAYVAAFSYDLVGRFEEPIDSDPYAAIRRAIVVCAAAIGRGE